MDYLIEWRRRLGEERVRVMLFETMRADPRSSMQNLCRWVDIDPSFYDAVEFNARNRTSAVRSHGFQRIANLFAWAVAPGPAKEAIKQVYYGIQSTGAERIEPAADERALAVLDEHFAPFSARLAREFGLDLEAWG